ncbi:hypothetical protein [Nonomuraea aridisoli]|uniref:hypothetical protein n=1 Tax=Nonomuraea aridisoli TaxID=2070368 RepID=UPI0015E8E4D1|nr:hypothetical protein [Nonomuraea aridisoli]
MLVDVADWIVDRYRSLQEWAKDRFAEDPREAEIAKFSVIAVCAAAVALITVTLLWLVIAVLGAIVQGMAGGLVTGLTWALERVADWHLTEVVTTPVHAYITAHAAGLPTGAAAIWSAWTVTGPFLWLLCWLARSWGARLAWVLYGAGTVAMVYSASPASGRMLAAGIAVLYWGVLSVFAFRGINRRPTVHVHPAPAPTTALEDLRAHIDEQFAEVRTRLTSMEAAAKDELAARRADLDR